MAYWLRTRKGRLIGVQPGSLTVTETDLSARDPVSAAVGALVLSAARGPVLAPRLIRSSLDRVGLRWPLARTLDRGLRLQNPMYRYASARSQRRAAAEFLALLTPPTTVHREVTHVEKFN